MLSHVATQGLSLVLQLMPHTGHLSWRLVMCSVVIFNATKLAELQAVHIFNSSWTVELFYPHSHAHILHFKQLQHIEVVVNKIYPLCVNTTQTSQLHTQMANIIRDRSSNDNCKRTFTLCFLKLDTMKWAMSEEII